MDIATRSSRMLPRALACAFVILVALTCVFAWPTAAQAVPGTITGTVTEAGSGVPIVGAKVEVWRFVDSEYWGNEYIAFTDLTGGFSAPAGVAGDYALKFIATGFSSITFGPEGPQPAAVFYVGDGQTVVRDAEMSPLAPAITGRLTGPTGSGFSDGLVRLYQSKIQSETPYWAELETAVPNANGQWAFYELPAGAYRVGFHPNTDAFIGEYYNNAPSIDAAGDIVYSPPTPRTGIDAQLAAAPRSIAGTVTSSGGVPVPGCFVSAYHWVEYELDPELSGWEQVRQTQTAANGSYAFYSLPNDTYRVGFAKAGLGAEYYNDKPAIDAADDVVYSGSPRLGISALLGSYGPDAYEPDDTALTARAIAVGSAAQTRTIAPAANEDWVTFGATAGVTYSIATTFTDGSSTDTLLELFGADGTTLLTSDDDGNGSGFSRIEYTPSTSGALFVRVRGALAGSVGAYGLRVANVPDTTPPSVVSNAVESYVGTATIQISAVDARSSIAYVAWRLDGGATQTVSATSTTVQTTVTGPHSLVFWAADTAGNISSASLAAFTITAEEPPPPPGDTTPPTVSTDAVASYVGTATIEVSAVDSGSGVVEVRYRLDTAATVTVSGDAATVVTSVLGAHTLRASAIDASGNVTPAVINNFTVTADGPPPPGDVTPPNVTATVAPSSVGTATVALSATDASSGVVSVSWRLDGLSTQTVPGSSANVVVTSIGAHSLSYWATDGASNVAAPKTANFTVTSTGLPPVVAEQLAGSTRYQTALMASQLAYPAGLDPSGPRTVVIATGANWPDALGGATLAGALRAPILLSDPQVLSAGVAQEITRLGATRAIVLGGTGAVSLAVESQLNVQLGDAFVERIGGSTRYQTAELVADRARETLGFAWDGTVLVATGAAFPDALAAAPLAAGFGWPLLLEGPGGLSAASKAFVSDGVVEAVILGGTGAVTPATQTYLTGQLGPSAVTRLAGPTRYQTAAAIAQYGVDSGFHWDGVAIATGQNFPDALAGGVLQGANQSIMLLTPSAQLDPSARAALEANRNDINTVTYLGGDGAVSPAVRAAVGDALRP